jgi:hypothetical protein
MTRRFHPRSLFGPWARPNLSPYGSEASVLDAVRDRKKALLYTGVQFTSLAEGDPSFAKLLEGAFNRGLSVVIDNQDGMPRRHWCPDVYVMHLDQAWRVPAHRALRDTAFVDDGRWTLSAEAQQSLLFGYTAAERKRWIAWQRQAYATRTSLGLYVLLTREQLANAKQLAMRCFGTPEQMEGLTLFYPRSATEPKRNAAALVPKGLTLARIGLSWPAARKLLGEDIGWPRKWVSVTLTRTQARVVTAGLKSNVQVMTARGWK